MTAASRPPVVGDGQAVRLACCIPFCRRTFAHESKGPWPEGWRTICGKHWRLGNPTLRRRHSRLKRLQRRGVVARTNGKYIADQIAMLKARCWDRIRIQATEAAAGIG